MMRTPITLISERNRTFRHRIEVESIEALYADAPKGLGGDGQDPDPHDYFDMALGSCKAITVQMYARRKEWPLEGITVTIARDDRKEREGEYGLDVRLDFQGPLDDAMKQKLLDISSRCPVQRLMTEATVTIETRLASATDASRQ
ncbi:OsmC family protein [Halomonas sp. PAMB 3264]|uniref:OsmC family protein n=1 Tax=unclassified Halomonas TaxID=2609666 RepID=UPI0028968A33|nr:MULTISPECIES: OsmC family protein [unclassified Halomonas]WNL40531.1 OsmC family protein [Halomonas sp. PAMB 3232]WNL43861.1 OsmC family protein [Halomonas sp. PAMB 3264]